MIRRAHHDILYYIISEKKLLAAHKSFLKKMVNGNRRSITWPVVVFVCISSQHVPDAIRRCVCFSADDAGR